MINKERFRENFQYYSKSTVVEVMDIFLDEYVDNLRVLQQGITELDFKIIDDKAHSIKGVVGYMSDELRDLSYIIEKKGKEKDATDLQPCFDRLKAGILELAEDIKELRMEYTQ